MKKKIDESRIEYAALTIEVLKTKVNAAFSMEIDEIKQRYSVVLEKNRRKIVLNMGYLCKLDNIHTIINEAKKEVNYAAIDEYYNAKLSVMDNLKVLQDNGVKVGRATLYRYCADRGIKVCYSDSEIIAMINANDSVRNNLKTLKDNGVKIGKDRVAKLLKQLKEGKVDINECSESGTGTNEGGSNSQKVTDTLSRISSTILFKNETIGTPNTTPTQKDIIDEMEVYLMQLEDEINNTSDNEESR